MTVRPLHDRIVVRRLEEGEQNIGGIIVLREWNVEPVQAGEREFHGQAGGR
jgi:co-chaperonin GroES (HSP10)